MKTILALIFLSFATVVSAQSNQCAPREAVLDFLYDNYGESRVSVALSSNELLTETFVSEETGTWTITITTPTGATCIVGSGDNFEFVDETTPTR